jgi:hypothetical protein
MMRLGRPIKRFLRLRLGYTQAHRIAGRRHSGQMGGAGEAVWYMGGLCLHRLHCFMVEIDTFAYSTITQLLASHTERKTWVCLH